MLASRLEIHAPQCAGASACTCHPILDAEAFVGSIAAQHFGVGVKRSDGSISGTLQLTRADMEDLHQYLLGESWIEAQRFSGQGRLNGFVLQRLHFRCTDWARRRFGSTRYGDRCATVPYDPRVDTRAHVDEYPTDAGDGRHIDRSGLSRKGLNQLALLELSIETDQPKNIVARELGVPASVAVLRREAVVCTEATDRRDR